MKITREQLKDLIIEEVRDSLSILLEMPRPPIGSDIPDTDDRKDSENKTDLSKQALFHMAQQAQQLHDILKDGEDLEPHIVSSILSAAGDIEEAFKAIIYDKQNPLGR